MHLTHHHLIFVSRRSSIVNMYLRKCVSEFSKGNPRARKSVFVVEGELDSLKLVLQLFATDPSEIDVYIFRE